MKRGAEGERDGGGGRGREGEQMGQPSGGWKKSRGDEKKREGGLEGCREFHGKHPCV